MFDAHSVQWMGTHPFDPKCMSETVMQEKTVPVKPGLQGKNI